MVSSLFLPTHPELSHFSLYDKKRNFIWGENSSGKSTLFWRLASDLNTNVLNGNKGIFPFVVNFSDAEYLPQVRTEGFFGLKSSVELRLGNASIDNERFEFFSKYLDVDKFADQHVNCLSDGEKTRLQVVLALSTTNLLAVFDEWQMHLDHNWKKKVNHCLNVYCDRFGGTTLELSSERLDENIEFSGRVFHLSKKNERDHDLATRFVREFIIHLEGTMSCNPENEFRLLTGNALKVEEVIAQLKHGDLLKIIGENGSGKTTLIRALKCKQNGSRPFVPISKILTNTDLQVDNVKLGSLFSSLECPQVGKFDSFIEATNISKDIYYGRLNFAHKRIMACLLAISFEGPIIAIDEPFVGLDAEARLLMIEIINAARNVGMIVIVSGFDVDDLDMFGTRHMICL